MAQSGLGRHLADLLDDDVVACNRRSDTELECFDKMQTRPCLRCASTNQISEPPGGFRRGIARTGAPSWQAADLERFDRPR